MSVAPIPKTLELRKMMEQRVDIEGKIELSKLNRLQDYLCGDSGAVTVRLAFGKDLEGVQTITGSLSAKVFMQCQRCLQPVVVEVFALMNIGVCYRESDLALLPAEYDPLLQGTPELDLWLLIEDELILNLPIVAHHSPADCNIDAQYQRQDDDSGGSANNPFSALAAMKGDDDQNS